MVAVTSKVSDDRATVCRKAFKAEKYSADPIPVRRVEGSVPRHN